MSGPATVEEGFSKVIPFDRDGIEDAVDGGQDVLFGKEGWLGADLDVSVLAFVDEGEEFDHVTQFGGKADIERGHLLDAADVDFLGINDESMGEGSEKDGLVSRVPTVDVEGFVSFGIAEFLGFLEGFGVSEAGLGHALKDVVGGSVDDSGNGFDPISNERFLDRFDDGNASGHGSLQVNGRVVLLGKSEKRASALGEKGFVSGHDGLPGFERGFDEVVGRIGSADEFHDNIDGRVVDDIEEIGGE